MHLTFSVFYNYFFFFYDFDLCHCAGSCMQLAISLVFIYVIPDTVSGHWIYLLSVLAVLAGAYVIFMKRCYHLHEEYLKGLK